MELMINWLVFIYKINTFWLEIWDVIRRDLYGDQTHQVEVIDFCDFKTKAKRLP